jgi:hypothetical protein
MTENTNTALGWPALAFLFAIVMFGVVLVGEAPKSPIYAAVLAWWGFVLAGLFTNLTTAPKPRSRLR